MNVHQALYSKELLANATTAAIGACLIWILLSWNAFSVQIMLIFHIKEYAMMSKF